MNDNTIIANGQRKALLVAVVRDGQDKRQVAEYLDELEFLAETAGIVSVGRITQKLAAPNPRIYVGAGKLEDIAEFVPDAEESVVK